MKIELPNVLIVDKTHLRATGQSQATEVNICLAYETIWPVIALMRTQKTNIYQNELLIWVGGLYDLSTLFGLFNVEIRLLKDYIRISKHFHCSE